MASAVAVAEGVVAAEVVVVVVCSSGGSSPGCDHTWWLPVINFGWNGKST